MSPIRLRRLMRGNRRRSAVLAVLLVVAVALAVHHVAPTHAGMHMGAAQACVAVLALGALALALSSRPVSLVPLARVVFLPIVTQLSPAPPAVAARAGPVHLQVLRL